MRKKVIISACLLGEYCRYDGKTKKYAELLEYFKEYEIIPFCPEAPLFGTPRERINVMLIDGEKRIITDETNKDVTQLLKDEILSFIEKNQEADAIVLKSKSPSCGYKTTPILDPKKEILKYENGIAADLFQSHYKALKIKDELNFSDF
ncbi:DUF523 domain-containing protein [Sulfurimonas marina]|uniref:DUF523 domain-containing protein n=1 Tax=Sulfurimonas marina TaxID=2590551 RepID=A0A7M1AX85_9BACT|nr:DUF523 domain-containing protein [Sulfurimonas marina]QOP42025.1 DUF523 domain-containing protein [Sulfurimonas marina]